MFRFETNTPDINWVLTDMDGYLKGNPYYEKNKPNDEANLDKDN